MNTANNLTRFRVSLVWLSTVAIAFMLVVLNIAPVAAQSTEMVMLSNLGEAEAERYQRTQLGGGADGHAQSFTTGSTAVTLKKVRLYLRGRRGPHPYHADLVASPSVTIRADNPVLGEPGPTLHVLTSPTIDSSIATYEDFTSDGYVLAANTTYWLAVHNPLDSDYFSFSVTISENWCRGRGTPYTTYSGTIEYLGPEEARTPPEDAFTGEPGWSLSDYVFLGLDSEWRESNCWSMRMGIYAGPQTANTLATGRPGIIGTVRAGETLTATTDHIADEDGLTGAVFNYQWVRSGTDIEGETTSTYTMTDADEGKAIKVRVTCHRRCGQRGVAGQRRSALFPAAAVHDAAASAAAVHDAAAAAAVHDAAAASAAVHDAAAASAASTTPPPPPPPSTTPPPPPPPSTTPPPPPPPPPPSPPETHSAPAVGQPGGFGDVPDGAYYSVPVSALAERGLFVDTGCEAGFCPGEPIDRKTMAVWIVRLLDGENPATVSETSFDDVDASSFYGPFIERMAELEVTRGCGDGSRFCPDRNVTRAEMAVFFSRAFDLGEGPDPGFSDVPADAWYADSVARFAASRITIGCGDGTEFCPSRATTRAEMATFLARALGLVETPGSTPPAT